MQIILYYFLHNNLIVCTIVVYCCCCLDIDNCTINSQDNSNICFICELYDELTLSSITILYRLKTVNTNEFHFQNNFTTAIGKKEIQKCIPVVFTGLYAVFLYIVDTANEATKTNPVYIIDNISHSAITASDTTTVTPTNGVEDGEENNDHIIFYLKSWRYRNFAYVGIG